MLRRRILSLWVLFSLISLVVTWVVLTRLEQGHIERTTQRLAGLRVPVDRLVEQRLLRQSFLGSSLARGRLAVVLDFLMESREDFLHVWAQAESVGPLDGNPASRERRQEVVATFRRGGAPVVDLRAERLAEMLQDHFGPGVFGPTGREGFVASEKTHLVQCLAVDPAFCLWDYTYTALMEELADLSRDWKLPVGSRVLVVDRQGTGLADSHKDSWSNAPGFCASLPLCQAALSLGTPQRDLALLEGTWNLATAVPLTIRGGVVGSLVILEPFHHEMVREDAATLGTEVAYLIGDSVVEATEALVSSQAVGRLASSPTSHGPWISAVFPLRGIPTSSAGRIVLAVRRSDLSAPYHTARQVTLFVELLLLLVGALVVFLFLESFLQRITSLYQGVHEVIHGDPNYRFPTDQKDEVLDNLGIALNVMALLARGKPLVDEEENASPDPWTGAASWESMDSAVDAYESTLSSGEEVLPDSHIDAASLASESAESYYRRLFQDFIAAHREAGLPIPTVSQQDFLARIVHLEQKLKRRYGVPQVRFVVTHKPGQVSLTPIRFRQGHETP